MVILPKPYSPTKNPSITTLDDGISGYIYNADWTPAIIGPTGWIDPTAVMATQSNDTNSFYAFGKGFWDNAPTEMSVTETYLAGMIQDRIVPETSPDILTAYFKSIYDTDNLTQYYTIPVMIHMIDMLKRTIPDVVNARNR